MTNPPTVVSISTINAAQDGDREALGAIFRAYQPALLRYIKARAAVLAEDVASQTWVSVAASIHNFRGDGEALRGWIITIGRRRLIDEFRRQGRHPEDPGDVLDIVDDLTPEDVVLSSAEWAQKLISELPAQQADVVLLRVIGGLSVEEVAEETGLTRANVRVLSHRGLARLEKLLTDGNDTDEVEEFQSFV